MTEAKPAVTFSNPEKKPLEELTFSIADDGGVRTKVPALNKRWAVRENFVHYIPLVGSGAKLKTDADLEEWAYRGEQYHEGMMFLLRLDHYEFWSYMIHQKTTRGAVVSFFMHSTPFYVDLQNLISDEEILRLYDKILSASVRVVCRIITNKESEEEWITKERLKELIYSNYLISIPLLFDMITALGETNAKVLKKIFHTVFLIEPKYKNDLATALQYFIVAFETIQHQAENEGAIGEERVKNENLDTPYDDLVLYTLDCAFTLSILTEVYPDARQICCDIKLHHKIANFYDNTIPYLCKNISIINEKAESLKWLNEARVQYLRAFRNVVYLYIEAVLENPAESLTPSENFIGIMIECLGDRSFVIDYQRTYPIELDIDILKQACKDLDEFRTDFVAKGYKDEADSEIAGMIGYLDLDDDSESGPELPVVPSTSKHSVPLMRPQPEAMSVDYDADQPSTSKAAAAMQSSTKNEPGVRDIDLEVSSVLEVLPHLGDGFIRRVLARYDNSEDAIAAILEQNLPPDLIHSDQAEVYVPVDPQDLFFQQTGIKRHNVFDGDKYDIMTQDNPDCIIKREKGFPDAPQSLNELLDDKKDLAAVRHRYQEYTLVEEGNVYDDEYDDSYDALLETESRAVKSKHMNTVLADIEDKSDEEEEEEEDEDESPEEEEQQPKQGNAYNDKQINFCENPEDVRARYEAMRAAKYANKPGRAPPQKPRDVVGAAKGQGQEKQVVINRHKKDVNKSSRANHNRKSGAAFKRSKGML